MNRLKEMRTLKKLTLRELEEATGITNSTLSAIENGKRNMNIRVATTLADFFGVSVDFMLGRNVSSMVDEFMTNLLKIYNPYNELPNEDQRTLNLAFIMKSIYEMDDLTLKQVRDYVAFINAKNDFGSGK